MRKIGLAILLALAITISPSEVTLAHHLDTSITTTSVRQSNVTFEDPALSNDDLGNQSLNDDDNQDND